MNRSILELLAEKEISPLPPPLEDTITTSQTMTRTPSMTPTTSTETAMSSPTTSTLTETATPPTSRTETSTNNTTMASTPSSISRSTSPPTTNSSTNTFLTRTMDMPTNMSGAYHYDWSHTIYELKEGFLLLKNSMEELKKEVRHSRRARREIRQPEVGEAIHEVNSREDNNGAVLGGKIMIEGVTKYQITSAENISTSPSKLALNLLTCLFTHEELSHGNCTNPRRSDIVLLDQKKIGAIRAHIQYKYPAGSEEEEGKRWKKILKETMNGKCRGVRNTIQL